MGIYFGADYYPEHWPRERWETDARLMRELGLDVVRMAEFSWAKLEPRLGAFDFGWLDDAIALLDRHGIKTVLGTPTPTPPAWIVEQAPDILPVDREGRTRGFGGRHHDCQSNPTYRAHVQRIVTAMAEHYRDNPGVIGWQTDNELGNSHQDLCTCPHCTAAFQAWLERKYESIDRLNEAWGTAFWSQTYDKFSQIPSPRITPNGHNPSLLLDWDRFCSDLIVEFQQFQIDILRRVCPNHFITHNFMGFADKVNYFDLAKNLDFISHDQYPDGFRGPARTDAQLAAALDLMRGTKQSSFWIMEQQAGITGWELMGNCPRPGQLASWAFTSIAHGADAVVFFRWRTCAFGTEEYWHGILPHSGIPQRRYDELRDFIAQMKPIMSELHGTVPKSETAILYSYDQNSAFKIQPHHPELTYIGQIQKYYGAFYRHNVPVDFVSDEMDFTAYRLLVAPLQYIMAPELEEKFAAYVKGGGTLLLTMRTGVKAQSNACMTERDLPGRLGDLAGIVIRDYDCLRRGNVKIVWDGVTFEGEKWADIITPQGARTLADYDAEFYSGTPTVTENDCGDGKVLYVGTEPDEAMAEKLCLHLIKTLGLRTLGDSPQDVEVAHRHGDGCDYIFVVNHAEEPRAFAVPAAWEPLIGGGDGKLDGFGYAVYRTKQ